MSNRAPNITKTPSPSPPRSETFWYPTEGVIPKVLGYIGSNPRVTEVPASTIWAPTEGVIPRILGHVGSNISRDTGVPVSTLDTSSIEARPAQPTVVEISYPTSSPERWGQPYSSVSYPTWRTVYSSSWALTSISTQTWISTVSEYQGSSNMLSTSALATGSGGIALDTSSTAVSRSMASDILGLMPVPTPTPTPIDSSQDRVPAVEPSEPREPWNSWKPGYRAGLVLGGILVPTVLFGLLFLWYIKKGRGLSNEDKYDEERGERVVFRKPEGIFNSYAISETRNRRIKRGRKARFTGDRRKYGSMFDATAQKVKGENRATSISSSLLEVSSSTTGLLLDGDIGGDSSDREPRSLSRTLQGFLKPDNLNSSSRDSRPPTKTFAAPETTGIDNPCDIESLGGETHDSFYYIGFDVKCHSDKALPITPSLCSPNLDSLTNSSPSLERPKISGALGGTSAIITKGTKSGDSTTASHTHLCSASSTHSRKYRRHGRGVPANIVRRHTVRGGKVIHVVPMKMGEDTVESMQDDIAPREPVQSRSIPGEYIQEYGTLEERLRGERPPRWG